MKTIKMLCFCFLIAILCGCSKHSESDVGIALQAQDSYGWEEFGQSSYSNGLFILEDETMYVFDAATTTMLPVCTRAECMHQSGANGGKIECPAKYLGERAEIFAVYEGEIWYLCQTENGIEVWTAGLNGENHKKIVETDLTGEDILGGFKSVFLDGFCYTICTSMDVKDDGTIHVTRRLLSVNLKDGTVEEITTPSDPSADLRIAGACDDKLFYTIVGEDEGKLVRKINQYQLETKQETLIAESGLFAMDDRWLAYVQKESDTEKYLEIFDAKKEEKRRVLLIPENSYGNIYLSEGKLLWVNDNASETDDNYYIYDIEMDHLATYQMDYRYHTWSHVGDGWISLANGLDGTQEYYFVKEADLSKADKMKQIH